MASQPLSPYAPPSLMASLQLWWAQWWPHRWAGVAAAWLITVLGCAALPWVAQRYESRARVYVETVGVTHEATGSWNAAGEADRQIRVLAKSVTAGPQVDRLVSLFGHDSAQWEGAHREAIVAGLLSRIRLVADEPGLYTIAYRDTDAQRSRQVVDGVVELFMSMGQHQRQREAQRALQVLEEHTRLSDQRLAEARQRLDAFVKEYGVQSLSDTRDIAGRQAALQESVSRLRAEVAAAEQARRTYRDELSQSAVTPMPPVSTAAVGAALPHGLHRLGEKHPEVIAARQASDPVSPGGTATAASGGSDPLQQRLRASLADANAQVAMLRSRLSAEETKLAQWRKPLESAPSLEPQWQRLLLDLETAQKSHETLLSKVESAAVALKADTDPQTTTVRVVEPARAYPAVLFPTRVHLALGLAAAALILGVTASLWMQGLKPEIRHAADLQRALGRPVVGQLPWLEHHRPVQQGASSSWAWAATVVVLCAVHAMHVTFWTLAYGS